MSKTKIRSLMVLAVAAAFMAPAQAQHVITYADGQGRGYRTEPLYPYVAQPSGRAYPYVTSRPAPAARPVSKVDPALVEELRRRGKPKASAKHDAPKPQRKTATRRGNTEPEPGAKITKTIVVREKPIIKKTYRVVEHPPVIVQREINEDQAVSQGAAQPPTHAEDVPITGRVIRAEAEVTILGPDRMSIRLYRKRDGSDASAETDRSVPKRNAKADGKSKIR